MNHKLSIIITNHQTPELLKECLRSIEDDEFRAPYEIIIIDNQSRGELPEYLKRINSESRYFYFKKNLGYAKLVNFGIRKSKGEYLLIINADIIVQKNSIEKMLNFFQEHPEAGIIGPKLLNLDGAFQQSCFRFYMPKTIVCRRTIFSKLKICKKIVDNFLMKDYNLEDNEPLEVDWVRGAALMTKKEYLKKVGLMDERFFMYFEDVDWCRRFRQTGFKVIYFPQAAMKHFHGQQSYKLGGIGDLFFNRYGRIHILSAIKYFWKWRKK